jgi:hypothetical protein
MVPGKGDETMGETFHTLNTTWGDIRFRMEDGESRAEACARSIARRRGWRVAAVVNEGHSPDTTTFSVQFTGRKQRFGSHEKAERGFIYVPRQQ